MYLLSFDKLYPYHIIRIESIHLNDFDTKIFRHSLVVSLSPNIQGKRISGRGPAEDADVIWTTESWEEQDRVLGDDNRQRRWRH